MQLSVLFSYRSAFQKKAIIPVLLSLIVLVSTSYASLTEQLQFQIQDIDSKIQTLKSEITECNNSLKKLTEDNVTIMASFQNSASKNRSPLSNIEKEIAMLSEKVSLLNKQIFEAKQDSSQLEQRLQQQKISYNRESASLRQLILDATNSIKTMSEQRDQFIKTASLTNNDAQVTINAEDAKIDLLLSNYYNELNNLNARREKLKQDSIILSAQLAKNQALASNDLRKYDSLITIVNHSVQVASNILSQAKTKYNNFKNSNKQILQGYSSQHAKTLSSYGLVSANLTKAQNDLKSIRSSLDAIISKYENGRAPLVKKIREIDSTIQTRQMQKSLWTLMNEKWSLDSAISAKRNELDEIIQQAALKRKNGMKLSEQKEAELNTLLAKLDQYLEKPGVKQATAQLSSLTATQKKARINEVCLNINNDLIRQGALKDQNSKALAAYEKNNPASNNPSIQKLQRIEQTITSLQTQRDNLNRQKDSLNALISSQTQAMNKSDVQYQKEIRSLDSSLSVHTKKSTVLSSQRAQALQSLSLSQKSNQDAISRITVELKNIDNKIIAINSEIPVAKNRKEQLKNELAINSQAFEQKKIQAGTAAQNLIGLIAKKEQESALLSNQLQQLSLQHNKTVLESQTAINTLKGSIQTLNSQLFSATSQHLNLTKQQSSMKSSLNSSEQELSKRISEIRIAKIAANQKQLSLQSELQQLTEKKAQLNTALDTENKRLYNESKSNKPQQNTSINYQKPESNTETVLFSNPRALQIQQPKPTVPDYSKSVQQYDSLIAAREQELLRLRTQRDKTIQQSQKQSEQKKVLPTSAAVSSTAKKTPPPVSQSNDSQIQSQKIIEQIYTLLGEEKMLDAYNLFIAKKDFLKNTAPLEAIRILENTFDGMQLNTSNTNGW
ncbi:MAG TPA: hypothetical protein VHP36_07130 [Chitinispirillaceae bacterium]|nr:hypothetical protein [Chitinispirillaceae bacterium]